MFPKIGTRSIRDALLIHYGFEDSKREAWRGISYCTRRQFRTTLNTPNTCIILRDPLERLHSCWKQKISSERDPGLFYFIQYYPLLHPGMSFLAFLKAISKLPVWAHEKHFIPLTYFLNDMNNMRYSFIETKDLDWKLSTLLRNDARPKRSNTTKQSPISNEAYQFFESHLRGRYELDITLLGQLPNIPTEGSIASAPIDIG